jgi:hypothetical protein
MVDFGQFGDSRPPENSGRRVGSIAYDVERDRYTKTTLASRRLGTGATRILDRTCGIAGGDKPVFGSIGQIGEGDVLAYRKLLRALVKSRRGRSVPRLALNGFETDSKAEIKNFELNPGVQNPADISRMKVTPGIFMKTKEGKKRVSGFRCQMSVDRQKTNYGDSWLSWGSAEMSTNTTFKIQNALRQILRTTG